VAVTRYWTYGRNGIVDRLLGLLRNFCADDREPYKIDCCYSVRVTVKLNRHATFGLVQVGQHNLFAGS